MSSKKLGINLYKNTKGSLFQVNLSVSPIGFEPMTASLEGRCSIQLSYEPVVFFVATTTAFFVGVAGLKILLGRAVDNKLLLPFYPKYLSIKLHSNFFVGVAGFEPATSSSQTRRDDRATLHPEVSAERGGFEPPIQLPV